MLWDSGGEMGSWEGEALSSAPLCPQERGDDRSQQFIMLLQAAAS